MHRPVQDFTFQNQIQPKKD
uniref:Uncharacterized protein n=1 Tax=Anguilla anguilla TaxID=7936 RepID=A0A0E9U0K3_ANGAN